MIDKYVSRRIRMAIRRVLLRLWDPIGVGNVPAAQDKYGSYLDPAFRLLTTGATDDQIAGYLWQVAAEQMSLGPGIPKEDMDPTVAALRQISLPEDRD